MGLSGNVVYEDDRRILGVLRNPINVSILFAYNLCMYRSPFHIIPYVIYCYKDISLLDKFCTSRDLLGCGGFHNISKYTRWTNKKIAWKFRLFVLWKLFDYIELTVYVYIDVYVVIIRVFKTISQHIW